MNIQSQPTLLGKTSAHFINWSALFKQRVKLIACSAWTTPSQYPTPPTRTPHFPLLHSWPMPTPTPSTGRCPNSFIVNLLLYGWFITKGFSLSCPLLTRRARRQFLQTLLSCISIQSQHQGAPLVQLSPQSVWTRGPRAVLMLIVNLFNPVLKMHKNMKQTPSNSRDFKMGILQIHTE